VLLLIKRQEKPAAMPFDRCPVCGREIVTKEIEKLLSGGVNAASV
jgi:hypothetical protein